MTFPETWKWNRKSCSLPTIIHQSSSYLFHDFVDNRQQKVSSAAPLPLPEEVLYNPSASSLGLASYDVQLPWMCRLNSSAWVSAVFICVHLFSHVFVRFHAALFGVSICFDIVTERPKRHHQTSQTSRCSWGENICRLYNFGVPGAPGSWHVIATDALAMAWYFYDVDFGHNLWWCGGQRWSKGLEWIGKDWNPTEVLLIGSQPSARIKLRSQGVSKAPLRYFRWPLSESNETSWTRCVATNGLASHKLHKRNELRDILGMSGVRCVRVFTLGKSALMSPLPSLARAARWPTSTMIGLESHHSAISWIWHGSSRCHGAFHQWSSKSKFREIMSAM